MFIRPKAHSTFLALLASIAAICLSACDKTPAPDITTTNPDQAAAGGPPIRISLTGQRFTSDSRLFIDGTPNGNAELNLDSAMLTFMQDHLTGTLNVASTAFPGAHSLSVKDAGGLSLPRYFYVSCAGCPPPPRLESIESIPLPNLPFDLGGTVLLRFKGKNFLNNDPSVSIDATGNGSGGVTLDPSVPVVVRHLQVEDVDFFDQRVMVAPNASASIHVLRVNTKGGTSNPTTITVRSSPGLAPRITAVFLESNCLLKGTNHLTVKGDNFAPGTIIHVGYVIGSTVYGDLPSVTSIFRDVHTMEALIEFQGDIAPNGFDMSAQNASGYSAPFSTKCSQVNAPLLRSVSPDKALQGTAVYVKCEGDRFGKGDIALLAEQGKGVTVEEILTPVAADPEHVRVAKLRLGPDATSVLLSVRDSLGQSSNLQRLTVSPAAAPDILSIDPDHIEAGTEADVTVHGFGPFPEVGSLHFSVQGVDINVLSRSSTSIACHVRASPGVLTNDNETNFVLGSDASGRPGNPIAFKVLPSTAGPVLLRLSPSRAAKGTLVWVECHGYGFGANGPREVRVQGSGVSASIQQRPTHDLDEILVPLISVSDTADTSGITPTVQVVDSQGRLSNALPFFVDDPASDPSRPFIQTFFNNLAFQARSGGQGGGNVSGRNLQGITDASWHITNTTAQFSKTRGTANNASFQIDVAAGSPPSQDAATNLTVITTAGESNPVAGQISP